MQPATHYTLEDLLRLMAVLRDEQYGCPWDVAQSMRTIVPHTLEEVYEVVDAIERDAFDELRLELGDLLFQIVYYAQLASEKQLFRFADIIDGIVTKMIARHPHVFPAGTLDSRRHGQPARSLDASEVQQQWEQRKARERDPNPASEVPAAGSLMDNVPNSLPALSRAGKLAQRSARLGVGWPDAFAVGEKTAAQLNALGEAGTHNDRERSEEEIGELLFAVASHARKLGIDPEQALRKANQQFERRFRGVEQRFRPGDRLADLNAYWHEVKAGE